MAAGWDINGTSEVYDKDDMINPLAYASKERNYDLVKLLLEKGANPNLVSGDPIIIAGLPIEYVICGAWYMSKSKNGDEIAKIIDLLISYGGELIIRKVVYDFI